MLKNLFFMTTGCLATYLYMKYPTYRFNTNLSVNIVIAVATCLATAMHYDSIRKQRKDRIWDINKNVLLELAHELSDKIKHLEKIIDEHFTGGESEIKPNFLEEKIDNALNVYKTLIGEELSQELLNYISLNKRIDHEVFEEGLDHMEAYEQSLESTEILYKKVLQVIEVASGVKG